MENLPLSPNQIASIIDQFKSVSSEDITINNLIEKVVILMSIIGSYKNMSGVNKKKAVVEILIHLVDESLEDNSLLETVLISIIPSVIDNMISVENGMIVFNNKSKCLCF